MQRKILYPGGALKLVLTYRNGVLHGAARQFYENGQLQIDMNYENGVPSGTYTLYYEAGNPQIKATLKNGKIFGGVQRYKGDGTPIDGTLFEEAAEFIPPLAEDIKEVSFMTEERFESAMEHFADAIERTAEGAAAVIEDSMSFAWSFRPVRFAGRALTFLTGAGLMASAVPLKKKGYHRAAKACLVSGGVVTAAQIIELAVFRRR